tara:strand:- start:104 stop:499 length:396 start_codon:yes stop_codon:yes gene_type:complete
MTIKLNTTIKNARLSLISDAADAGTTGAKLTIYSGTRPATGGTVTTALITLPMQTIGFNAPSGGVMTAKAISAVNIATSGTASWFRLTDSSNAFVCDGSVATSGSDMTVPTTSFTAGVTLTVTSLVLTDAN